ncbi:hypothetical protein [Pseudomonas cremoricolorata]|uniref:Phosphotransferase system, HPr-related protein n=1 Tax=Pseudomonas cremoricolorata TaxID=157783 RepID=A0A089YHD5_9PSED|nr:hypothetical protein [Pseudomonas cremoricolorata]AIR91098.1 phosphotransferase system, HPr-related protein [Pseudomonas cremoricolorata]
MAHKDDTTTPVPAELDNLDDRMGSVHELDFSDRAQGPQGRIGDELSAREVEQDYPEQRVANFGMSGGEALTEGEHEDGVTDDDLSPGTLFDETGARDPYEPGNGGPADQDLREVPADEIGAGTGLDEAELAHRHPLDGKPWSEQEDTPDNRDDA